MGVDPGFQLSSCPEGMRAVVVMSANPTSPPRPQPKGESVRVPGQSVDARLRSHHGLAPATTEASTEIQ